MDVTRADVSAVQLAAAATTASLQVSARIVRSELSVSEVKARAAIQFIEPTTQVAYVVPAADLSYIILLVDAELDVRGLSPIVRDMVPVVDLRSFALSKVLSDQFGATDAAAVGMEKTLANDVFAGDVIDVLLIIGRTLVEELFATDTSEIGLGLNKNELLLTADAYSFLYGKGLEELLSATESARVGFQKAADDSVSTADDASVGISKPTSELLSASDESVMLYDKPVNDGVTVADSAQVLVDYVLQLSDFVSVLDDIDLDIIVTRTLADTANFTGYSLSLLNEPTLNVVPLGWQLGGDFVRIAIDRVPAPLADATGVTESGSYLIQNYTSADYFAQDYIGTTGSF